MHLNAKYGLGLDVERIAVCQESHDKENEKYRMVNFDRILDELKENGFTDAAKFLEKKM